MYVMTLCVAYEQVMTMTSILYRAHYLVDRCFHPIVASNTNWTLAIPCVASVTDTWVNQLLWYRCRIISSVVLYAWGILTHHWHHYFQRLAVKC